MSKINLASGQRPFPKPWVNIDAQDQGYPVDIITDAKDLSMIEDKTVDIIVAHHLVEHIAIHDLSTYIGEWFRVLKNGGLLCVWVPNLKKLSEAWINGNINTYIHNVNTYGAWQGSPYDLHRWGYDEQELDDRMACKSNENKLFEWSGEPVDRGNPLLRDANVSYDWWILDRQYRKQL